MYSHAIRVMDFSQATTISDDDELLTFEESINNWNGYVVHQKVILVLVTSGQIWRADEVIACLHWNNMM